jgi:hypothetical protein
MKKYHFEILALFIFMAFCAAPCARAAVIAVQPVTGAHGAQVIEVTLNTQGQSVNALAAHLTFNPSEFSIAEVTDGGSVVNLWIEPPTFSNSAGTVDFSGIIPGGADVSDGTVVNIDIVPAENGVSAGFQVASATALLNDGKGTPASLTIKSGSFAMTVLSSTPPLAVNTQPPDPFVPEVGHSPTIFNDQYFVSFSTTDQNSGINHYEVLEVPTGSGGAKSSGWQVAQSSYLLQDQMLSSNIYVRAVDNAGNFRMEEVPAMHPASPAAQVWNKVEILLGVIVVLLIIGGIFGYTWKWKRKRRLQSSG